MWGTETASAFDKGGNNKSQMFKNIDLAMCTPHSPHPASLLAVDTQTQGVGLFFPDFCLHPLS